MKFTMTCALLMTIVFLTLLGDTDANVCCYKCWRIGLHCRVFPGGVCRCGDGSVIAAGTPDGFQVV